MTLFRAHEFRTRSRYLPNYKWPKIILTPDAYARMSLYVEVADQEISWLGTAHRLSDGDFVIDKLFLLDQDVGATHTELSVEGLNELAVQFLTQGEQGIEDWNNLRFWGHSHVFMDPHPSSTDEATMAHFQDAGHPWFIRGIFNKKGQAEFSIFLFEDGLRIEDAQWVVRDRPASLKGGSPQVSLLAQPGDEVESTVAASDEATTEAAVDTAENKSTTTSGGTTAPKDGAEAVVAAEQTGQAKTTVAQASTEPTSADAGTKEPAGTVTVSLRRKGHRSDNVLLNAEAFQNLREEIYREYYGKVRR